MPLVLKRTGGGHWTLSRGAWCHRPQSYPYPYPYPTSMTTCRRQLDFLLNSWGSDDPLKCHNLRPLCEDFKILLLNFDIALRYPASLLSNHSWFNCFWALCAPESFRNNETTPLIDRSFVTCHCVISSCIENTWTWPYFTRGGADLPQPRKNACTRRKSMGGNSDNFCIFLNVCYVREKPFFMVKQLSVWSGDHWIGQKALFS